MDRPTSAWSALSNRTWPLNSSNLEYDLNEQWGQVTTCLLNPLVARSGFLAEFGGGCEHKGKLTSDSLFPTLIISTSQQNLRAPWQSTFRSAGPMLGGKVWVLGRSQNVIAVRCISYQLSTIIGTPGGTRKATFWNAPKAKARHLDPVAGAYVAYPNEF